MLHEFDPKKAPLILVAEDNKTTQRTITIFLKNQGYRVIEVDDGQQAVNLARSRCFWPVRDRCPDRIKSNVKAVSMPRGPIT